MQSRLSLSVLAFVSTQVAWAQMDEFRVNTYTAGDQSRPAAAMGPSGNFVVVWESSAQDGSGTGIFAQRYDGQGAPVGPEFLVNSVTLGNQARPSAAMDDSGRLVIVWQSQGDGSDSGIFARRFDGDGAPLGLDFQVNVYTSGAQIEPDVAVDDEGGFIFVWQSRLPDAYSEIRARHFDQTGSPSGDEFTVSAPSRFIQDTDSPAVATGGDGEFVVAYNTEYYHDIRVRPSIGSCDLGASRGEAGLDVEMAPSGDYVVAFVRFAFESGDIKVQRFHRCDRIGAEALVNSRTENQGHSPRVAGDASGNFVVTWVSVGNGLVQDIFARGFNSQGEGLGDEFLVNSSYRLDDQSAPAVAMNASGRAILAWQDSAHDGSGSGIYARLLEFNTRSIPIRPGDGDPLERTPRPIVRPNR